MKTDFERSYDALKEIMADEPGNNGTFTSTEIRLVRDTLSCGIETVVSASKRCRIEYKLERAGTIEAVKSVVADLIERTIK